MIKKNGGDSPAPATLVWFLPMWDSIHSLCKHNLGIICKLKKKFITIYNSIWIPTTTGIRKIKQILQILSYLYFKQILILYFKRFARYLWAIYVLLNYKKIRKIRISQINAPQILNY